MHRRRPLLMAGVLLVALAAPVCAQSGTQSPRQAIVEMFSGSEEKFREHLTPEVQKRLVDLLKNSPAGTRNSLQALATGANGEKFDAFDSGPILFSVNNAPQHQRYELHVESDELRGDEDVMELSLHSFRSGVEEEMPVRLLFQLGLKLVESVWRLNTFTVSARLPVGDPRILDQSWWLPQMFAAGKAPDQAAAADDRPPLSPMRAVRRIALAEILYAQHYPDLGFTCALTNLINVGKGLDEIGPYKILEPELAAGVYNGYRFSVRGCHGAPARTFQVIAEPMSGKGKAYCSDDRQNLRSSDDGRGLTCLATGRIARQ